MTARARHPRLAATPVRAVTFDCWGTLIHERDTGQAHAVRVEAVLRVASGLSGEVNPEMARKALDRAWHRHYDQWQAAGRASGPLEIAAWTLTELGVYQARAARELAGELAEASSHSEIVVLEGAHETLFMLSEWGVRRALVCDTGLTPGSRVRHLLAETGLLGLLEAQAFSDEVGLPKPHAAPFHRALHALGSRPTEALHVGDMRRTDVAGARALGMGSIRIRDHHDDTSDLPEADAVVDSHAELRRLLEEVVGEGT